MPFCTRRRRHWRIVGDAYLAGGTYQDWAMNGWVSGDWWRVTWTGAQSLSRVRLWNHWKVDYFGNAGRLRFSDGSTVNWTGLPLDPGPNGENYLEVNFPRKTGITWMDVVSDTGGNGNAGLSEVEAYDDFAQIRARTLNVVADPPSGIPSYSAIRELSVDYRAAYAANGLKGNGTGAGVAWAATGWVAGDWWRVSWSASQSLSRVRLWNRVGGTEYFGSSERLRFSDASVVSWSGLSADPGPNGEYFLEITFPRKSGITSMEVVSDAGGRGNAGLAEVEAYDDAAAGAAPVIGAFRLLQNQPSVCSASRLEHLHPAGLLRRLRQPDRLRGSQRQPHRLHLAHSAGEVGQPQSREQAEHPARHVGNQRHHSQWPGKAFAGRQELSEGRRPGERLTAQLEGVHKSVVSRPR